MKQIIPMNEYGIFVDKSEITRLDSRFVAETFSKQHKNVMRDIDNLLSPDSGLSPEFGALNFEPTFYRDQSNRKQKSYAMTRDGFAFLVMGYTGRKAVQFKEAYIRRFNEMESQLFTYRTTRQNYPLLTQAIQSQIDDPKAHHFINEINLIYKTVLGVDAKRFRELHDLPKGANIRPYLTENQLKQIDDLQLVDIGFLAAFPNYYDRKQQLELYHTRSLSRQTLDSRRLPCHDVNQQINAQYFPG